MEIALGIALLAAVVMIAVLTARLHSLTNSLVSLTSQIGDRAQKQFDVWKQGECERIRRDERELATRDVNFEFKRWKDEYTESIRKEAIKQSQSVTVGKVTEHIAPYLPGFHYNPKDARFIGSPVDLIVFDGLDSGSLKEVVFIEVKTGGSKMNLREQQVCEAIRARRVRWEQLRPDQLKSDTKPLFPADSL